MGLAGGGSKLPLVPGGTTIRRLVIISIVLNNCLGIACCALGLHAELVVGTAPAVCIVQSVMFQLLPEHRRVCEKARQNVIRRPAICEQALPRTELPATTQGSPGPPQLSQPELERVDDSHAIAPPEACLVLGSQDKVAAMFSRSRDRVSTARRLFQRCRHLSDLNAIVTHLPQDCRGPAICSEAYAHAARLHDGIKRYRKRNNKVNLHMTHYYVLLYTVHINLRDSTFLLISYCGMSYA